MKLGSVLILLLFSLLVNGVYAQNDHDLPIDVDNAADIKLVAGFNTGTEAITLNWSPDGNLLAVATEASVLLYNVNDLSLTPRELPISQVISLVFSPDGQSIATSSNFGGDGIGIWDLKTGGQQVSFKDEQPNMMATAPAVAMAFSPDGKILATQHYLEHLGIIYDPWVRIWNIQTGKLLAKIDGGGMSITFSPDGTLVAATVRDTVRIWNLDRILITNSDDVLLEDLVLNGNSILEFSEDSKQMAYLRDGDIQIWDIGTEQIINRPDSADNSLCAAKIPFPIVINQYQAQKYSVQLWDGCQNVLVATLDGHTSVITGAIFNPDNTLLATSNQDGTVRLWGVLAN